MPCVGREEEEESHDGNIRFGWILERCREVVLKIYKYLEGNKNIGLLRKNIADRWNEDELPEKVKEGRMEGRWCAGK